VTVGELKERLKGVPDDAHVVRFRATVECIDLCEYENASVEEVRQAYKIGSGYYFVGPKGKTYAERLEGKSEVVTIVEIG